MTIEYRDIGIIRSPFTSLKGMPIQPASAGGAKGRVEVDEAYRDGLKDLEGFSHIILIYHFHLNRGFKLLVTPYLDTEEHGVFSTRAPRRPNPVGLSVVRLDRIEGNVLHITDVDVADSTPLLDIKPYVPEFNSGDRVRTGWIEKAREHIPTRRSYGRFVE